MSKRNRERRREKQRKQRVRGSAQPSCRHEGGEAFSGGRAPGPEDVMVVEAMVLAAADAYGVGDEPAYARHVAALGLADPPEQSSPRCALLARVVASMADQALAAAWERGWQPADVERIVRRRLQAGHGAAVVAAMAHQHRRYAAATVAPEWRAQLRALGADPWDAPSQGEEPGVLPLGGLGGAAQVDHRRATVECLSVLWTLPGLPRLLPVPGESRRTSGRGGGVDARILERVRALLSKAESSTFVDEAEAFTAKAQELMARHAVDRAMIDDARPPDEPAGRRVGIDDPYGRAKSLLLALVADANRCRSVWSKDLGFSTVFGHEADLDGVELLYTSLLVQATTAMAGVGRTTGRSARTPSFRSSFLVAYAERIGQRLKESTEAAEAAGAEEHGVRLLPVLAARGQAVDDAVDSAFPGLKHSSVSVTNGAGWAAGTAAANLARLAPYQEVTSSRAS